MLPAIGAQAQESYPNRPIKLIVPFAAGGIIGTDAVVKSPPDGCTLCVCGNGPLTVTPWTEKVPYDPLKGLVPISLVNTNALVPIVNLKVEAKSVAELVALSRKAPGA